MPRPPLALVLLLPALAGCHLSHENVGAEPMPIDGGLVSRPRDAGGTRADAGVDAALPIAVPLDAGPLPDAGDVLPVEPEPDGGPDDRPTGPWEDTPPPPPDEPTLEPIGEPIELDDETDGGGPPAVVWSGREWGVAWSGRFRVLDEDARPISAAARSAGGTYTALDFAIGRFALAVTGRAPLQLGAFDREGRLAAGWHIAGGAAQTDVARLETAHRWIVATSADAVGSGSYAIDVFTVDDAMRPVSTPLRIASDGTGDVRIAGAKSRVLVTWSVEGGVEAQVIGGDPPRAQGSPFRVFEMPLPSGAAAEVEVFRDVVAIASVDDRQALHFALYDTWEGAFRSEPRVIGQRALTDRRPGLAVSPERGFFVACWGSGAGYGGSSGDDGITLQVVGPDGALWGAPVELVSHEPNVGGVDCGWNGREIVVIWWRASGGGAYNTIFAQRMRPTFL